MTAQQKMLLETLAGHLALLEEAHPRKAASAVARKAKSYVRRGLRGGVVSPRALAA